ncbi:hypothetical protein FOMPIDRAFT_1021300, partial [Fomitopsis schrenkii]
YSPVRLIVRPSLRLPARSSVFPPARYRLFPITCPSSQLPGCSPNESNAHLIILTDHLLMHLDADSLVQISTGLSSRLFSRW